MTPNGTAKAIGAEVRAEMERQGKKQREVAAAVGIDQASFWRRMDGTIPFRADELAKVAEFLGVPVAQFYGELPLASGPPDNRPPNKPPGGPGGPPPPPPPTSPPPAKPPAKTTGRAA